MTSPKIFGPESRNYHSTNLFQGIEYLIPKVYFEEDYTLSGKYVDPIDQLLNSHLVLANNISSILPINPITGTVYSSIDSISGIANYFIIQNDLSELTPDNFEKKILIPLGKSFKDFGTSAEFYNYLSGTFVPGTKVNSPTLSFVGHPNAHLFLIQNLSWLYFLNTSGHGNLAFSPSSAIVNLLSKVFIGKTIFLNDSIKLLEEYLWKNYSTCSTFRNLNLIPPDYLPQSYIQTSANLSYVSGIQPLEHLQTLTDILYSPLFIDRRNFKVRSAFETYLNTQTKITTEVLKGPFSRLIKAFSYGFSRIQDDSDKLSILYDLEQCPDELLPELANLIGWSLFGFDPNRWRLQLVNAVDIYKKSGTKVSIQLAVDSMFSEDVFNIEPEIKELWESYIPNLIYYSLATESSALESFKTWTNQLAARLGVNGYSTSSMDENIRFATDAIIYTLVLDYPDNFSLGGKRFPVGTSSFVFNYRGRNYPIPPWEEYPYYVNADLTDELVDKLADLLVCFGVREEFALEVRKYILENTLEAYDDLRMGNGWLFFTSSVQVPANWTYVLNRLSDKRTEALDFWSNKSSHFKLLLNSSDFDFTKATFEYDSFQAVREASRAVNEFSPAHSIPDIQVVASAIDVFIPIDFSAMILGRKYNDGYYQPPISPNPEFQEFVEDRYTKAFTNSELSGVSTRDLYPSSTFGREFVDSITDPPFSGSAVVLRLRNAFVRRNFRFGYNQADFYTRDGFNMPISWDLSTLEKSLPSSLGFLPLGYIPSAGRFMHINNFSAIPDVYSFCVNLNSSAVFSGVAASATFPCRGLSAVGSGIDYYVDRDQIPPLWTVAHKLKEESKYILAEKTLFPSLSNLQKDFLWKNVYKSYANSATEILDTEFPSSREDYLRFQFGKGIHQLNNYFYSTFLKHSLNPRKFIENGPNIFAHTYGSILENSDFYKPGNLLTTSPQYEASAINQIIYLDRTNMFVSGFNGTTFTSSISSILVSSIPAIGISYGEYRNQSVYSGVDLVMPNTASRNNYFAFVKIAPVTNTLQNSYFVDNTMLLMRNIESLPRIRYQLRGPTYPTEPLTKNLLIPDHEFKFTVKSLAINDTGEYFGGVDLGVWIHTNTENNKFWNFNKDNSWSQTHVSSVTQDRVINEWTHIHKFPVERREVGQVSGIRKFNCINLIFGNSRINPLLTVTEKDFKTFEVNFHTCNLNQELSYEYARDIGQLHRPTQDYIIEIFMLPRTEHRDKLLILDHVDLVDLSLNNRAKYKVDWGTFVGRPFYPYCPVSSVPVTENDLLNILLEFKKYTEDHAFRNYVDSVPEAGEYRKKGRGNYRILGTWEGTRDPESKEFTNINITN